MSWYRVELDGLILRLPRLAIWFLQRRWERRFNSWRGRRVRLKFPAGDHPTIKPDSWGKVAGVKLRPQDGEPLVRIDFSGGRDLYFDRTTFRTFLELRG